MKSIKEQAEELVEERVELSREESLAYFQGVEDGANYVLELIETLTDHQNWCAFPKQSYKELKELIEQLKK